MDEPDRTRHLLNVAVAALADGQTALDEVIRDLDDRDLEALIDHMSSGIGLRIRLSGSGDVELDRRPTR